MARQKKARGKVEKQQWLADKRQPRVPPCVEAGQGVDSAVREVALDKECLQPQEGAEASEDSKPKVAKASGGKERVWGVGITAEADFRAYYESQRLFRDKEPISDSEFELLWRVLKTPLPITVRVDRNQQEAPHVERQLSDRGWLRRHEFKQFGFTFWQLEDNMYSANEGVREWTQRENRCGNLVFQELVASIPALLLTLEPGNWCLDLCAAPGNKSVQLLQALRMTAQDQDAPPEDLGAVLSADMNAQRCCLAMYRILSKAASPSSCSAVANAKDFPVLMDSTDRNTRLEYDRILADVPCSGDGTTRKNNQVLRSWSRKAALELFSTQRSILMRGLYLLAPGGTLVYSTCSMNPIENEAVVLSALRRWRSAGVNSANPQRREARMELVDATAACRTACGLKFAPGISCWVVPAPQRGGPCFSSWAEVPAEMRCESGGSLRPEMFIGGDGSADDSDLTGMLTRCARFYPHQNDAGGFFVAMFRKEGQSLPPPLPKTVKGGGVVGRHPLLNSRFKPITASDETWIELVKFFGIDPTWAESMVSRGVLFWQSCNDSPEPLRVTLVSDAVKRLWEAPSSNGRPLPWVRLGVVLFELLPKKFLTEEAACRWRIAAEGIQFVIRAVRFRVVRIASDVMLRLLDPDNQHRQAPLDEVPGALDGAGLQDPSAAWHSCGGVLVGLRDAGMAHIWVPGALTPRQLRLLVDSDAAASLSDMLREVRNSTSPATASSSTCSMAACAAGLGDIARRVCVTRSRKQPSSGVHS